MRIKDEILRFIGFINWIKPDIRTFLPALIGILLISASGGLFGVAIAIASKNMIDYAVAGELNYAGITAAIFTGIIVINILLRIGGSLLSVRVNEAFSNAMRRRFFKRLLETEWLPLSAYHSGDLLTRLTSDVNNVTNCIVNVIPNIFALAVQLTASFITLLHYEPKLAMLAFILGPSTVLFSRIWGRKLKKINIKIQETESVYRSFIQEVMQNVIISKSFRLEKRNNDVLNNLHKNRMEWIIKKNRTTLSASTIISLGFWAGYFLAFGWGTYRLSQKAISFGTLTAFLTLVQQVQTPFVGLAGTFPQIIAMLASTDRLKELEKMEVEKSAQQVPKLADIGISFRQVSFKYRGEEPVLDKITSEILPGQLVALVGSSGEGKTTMVRLLLALLRPSEGEVCFIDSEGRRYEASAATRDWLTYVPQGNTLFSGSIAENLRNGKPDATLEEMKKALRAACAWDFIQEFPQGINTLIGEHGLGLSEGQAQRIAIARALIRETPVLILDEATSSLDINTEAQILQNIKGIIRPITTLVITHRPSAFNCCTRVLRLQDGLLSEIDPDNLDKVLMDALETV